MSIDNDRLRKWLEAVVEESALAGANAERAAVVAYLRYQAEVFVDDERALCRAAADIEQGAHRLYGGSREHRREETP